MPINYSVRLKCDTEVGDGKGFHYERSVQVDVINDQTQCLQHPEDDNTDEDSFVIELIENV